VGSLIQSALGIGTDKEVGFTKRRAPRSGTDENSPVLTAGKLYHRGILIYMGEKQGLPDNNGQVLPPTNPFSVLNVLRALAQIGTGGPAGSALAAGDLAARVAQAQNGTPPQGGAPAQSGAGVVPAQNQGGAQPSQSGSGGSFTDWLADKLYGRTPPPTSPPAPGPPPMKGVNPVTGENLFSRNPKGEAGRERPGVGGAGNFGAGRGPAEHRRTHKEKISAGRWGPTFTPLPTAR
jgi:hypothetical protein